MLGFLIIRPQLFAAGDPVATLANLTENESLARLGLGLELLVVLTQSLAAVWFYKLFHSLNRTAAFGVAVFGLMNAAAIMASAAFLATASAVAGDPTLAVGGDAATTVQLLFELSGNSWGVGAVFFGLWLIPMGYVVSSSGRFPRPLGWVLMAGGAGYVLSAFVGYGLAGAPMWLVDGLAYPATVGEFWIIGYLLVLGIRPESAR
jgi:hypothetical protein